MENIENKEWDLRSNVFESILSVEDMVNAIYVFEKLKFEYPNNDNITLSIELLRDEICKMFGGTIYNNV